MRCDWMPSCAQLPDCLCQQTFLKKEVFSGLLLRPIELQQYGSVRHRGEADNSRVIDNSTVAQNKLTGEKAARGVKHVE